MYKQFVKNMDNFITLNNKVDNTSNYRFEIAESLKNLTDVNKFLELRTVDIDKFNELSNIIWELGNNIDKYPAFKFHKRQKRKLQSNYKRKFKTCRNSKKIYYGT